MRLYVIGPVTGRENLNRAAFEDAREKLERAGYAVTIPHDLIPSDASHEDAILLSIKTMLCCDGVAMLDDWDTSPGARLENRVATACGLQAHCVGARLLMAGVLPENDNSPEETQNPPSDGVPAPSNEVLGALARRMDETNALLRAVYGQISALTAIETGVLMKSVNRSTGELVDSSLKAVSRYTEISDAYFRSAGKDGQDDRKA